MAIRQINASVQNDGNYSLLDCQDIDFGGPLMRIETYRASQPANEFGQNAIGGTVQNICGIDHLSKGSAQIFRHVFSVAESNTSRCTLEFRECWQANGAWEVRTRDLDPDSETFGLILVSSVTPSGIGSYRLQYEIREPTGSFERREVLSPLVAPVAELTGLPDIGAPLSELGGAVGQSSASFDGTVGLGILDSEVDALTGGMTELLSSRRYARWQRNVVQYQRFGDFRDKAVHPGTNLTGPNPRLASELMTVRAYRASMILLGRVFDIDMTPRRNRILELAAPVEVDTKPGVYAIFLSAYLANIDAYKLSLDKVHSDYSGVPLALAAGSKMENGKQPQVSADAANRTLAEIAFVFYVGETGLTSIQSFGLQ